MSDELLVIPNPEIFWTNFEGRAETYNNEGHRYFFVRVPDDKFEQATNMGLNVKNINGENYLKVSLAEQPAFEGLQYIYEDQTIKIYGRPWEWKGHTGVQAVLSAIV